MTHRSRPRAYLLLARVSNLPTVWTNVLAGSVVSGAPLVRGEFLWLAAAVSALYTAGMFLNDAFDRDVDARARADRPIPSGDIGAGEAFAVGWTLLLGGVVLAALGAGGTAVGVSVLLALAIVYYDYRHKRDPFGPVAMGACRGLVYLVAAASVGSIAPVVVVAALVMTAYVASLTVVAKRLGPHAGLIMPLLIAGISIVDAAVIGVSGGGVLAWYALAGFVATLLLQRVVPGT